MYANTAGFKNSVLRDSRAMAREACAGLFAHRSTRRRFVYQKARAMAAYFMASIARHHKIGAVIAIVNLFDGATVLAHNLL
jgi:hypothetical protein